MQFIVLLRGFIRICSTFVYKCHTYISGLFQYRKNKVVHIRCVFPENISCTLLMKYDLPRSMPKKQSRFDPSCTNWRRVPYASKSDYYFGLIHANHNIIVITVLRLLSIFCFQNVAQYITFEWSKGRSECTSNVE